MTDNVYYGGGGEEIGGGYHGEFTPRVLKFVKNDLRFVPSDQLVVVAMHIPLTDTNSGELLQLLESGPQTGMTSSIRNDIINSIMKLKRKGKS